MQTNLQCQKVDQLLLGDKSWFGKEGGITKRQKEAPGSDGNYSDYGDAFTDVYNVKTNWTLNKVYVNHT